MVDVLVGWKCVLLFTHRNGFVVALLCLVVVLAIVTHVFYIPRGKYSFVEVCTSGVVIIVSHGF